MDFRSYRDQGDRGSRRAFKGTVRAVVLTLLFVPAPLRAQSGEYRTSGHQERDESLKPRESNGPGTPGIGLGLNSPSTSTATAVGTGVATDLSSGAFRVNSSSVAVGVSAAALHCADRFFASEDSPHSLTPRPESPADDDKPAEGSKPPSVVRVRNSQPIDLNRSIYYKNKLEFSFEAGWHPVNIPFVYDFAVGDGYTMTPLKYTLVPMNASLRWHVNDIGGRWIFRGNFDFTFTGSVTLIPRGPETHYFAFIFGIRRNFVHRNWRIVPYFDERGGVGYIDAKEPLGVLFAQGQNLTFTYNMGAGIRYNLDSRYSISAGMNYMHISNGYLSEPKFTNYGINVYGPLFGIDVRLGKRHASQ